MPNFIKFSKSVFEMFHAYEIQEVLGKFNRSFPCFRPLPKPSFLELNQLNHSADSPNSLIQLIQFNQFTHSGHPIGSLNQLTQLSSNLPNSHIQFPFNSLTYPTHKVCSVYKFPYFIFIQVLHLSLSLN
jgi:hypothetical protein